MQTLITQSQFELETSLFPIIAGSSKENLCRHAASKLFDEVDIVSQEMPCFTDNILGYKNYLDTFFLSTYILLF